MRSHKKKLPFKISGTKSRTPKERVPKYNPEFVKMVKEAEAEYEAGNYVSFENMEAMSKFILSGGNSAEGVIVNKGK
jgi:hypothetical protein